MVPTGFWGAITPLDFDPDVEKALLQFHELMCLDDMSKISTTQYTIIETLETKCKDRIQELMTSQKPKHEIFESIAILFAGHVMASADVILTTEPIQKELAAYLGVMGAKKTTASAKAPQGYKANEMPKTLRNLYIAMRKAWSTDPDNESVKYHSSTNSPRHQGQYVQPRTLQLMVSPETTCNPDDVLKRESKEVTLQHNYLPTFKYTDGDITIDERRKALKVVKKMTHPDGPFKGLDDKRSIRAVLEYLKMQAKSQFLTIVEYSALLDASLSIEIRSIIPDQGAETFTELHKDIVAKVDDLIMKFGATPEAERAKQRSRFANTRQNFAEDLLSYATRFDRLLIDMRTYGAELPDSDIMERFIDSLQPNYRQQAQLLRYAQPTAKFHALKNELIAMRRDTIPNNRLQKSNAIEKTVDGTTCKRCGNAHRVEECTWKADVECRNCGKTGHIGKVCRQPRSSNSTEHKPEVPKTATSTNAAPAPPKKQACIIEISAIERKDNDNRPHLDCDVGGQNLQVLLDSGAECSVISTRLFEKLQGREDCKVIDAEPIQIRSACNKDAHSDKEILVPITHGKTKVTIPFRLYEPLKREAIIGVNGLQSLRATLKFQPTEDDPPYTEICEIFHDRLIRVPEEFDTNTDNNTHDDNMPPFELSNPILEILERRLEVPELRTFDKSKDDITNLIDKIDYCLQEVHNLGSMTFAKDYQVRLQRLQDGDPRDTDNQMYRFDIQWSLKDLIDTNNLPRVWNSSKAIDNLSTTQKLEWNAQLNSNIETKWWTSPESTETHGLDLSAVVFPVTQSSEKTTTVRPCSDFRRLNKASPPISAVTPSVAEAVLKLRTTYQADMEIRQYDLAKAFYRISTTITDQGKKFSPRLKVANKQYTSDRLVFGLSCGPSGLNVTQDIINFIINKILKEYDRSLLKNTTRIIVMDDYLLVGYKETIDLLERLLDHAWKRTGFDSPPNKRTIWNEKQTRWLGGHWTRNTTGEIRLIRPSQKLTMPLRITKRNMFGEAGKIMTILASVNETIARTHCDAMRILVGTQKNWDDEVTDKQILSKLKQHIDEANHHYTKATEQEQHVIPIHSTDSVIIECDASNTGFGMICSSNSGNIYTYAKIFSNAQKVWHINRKELYSIALCLQKVDTLVCLLPRLRAIEIHTDSKVALLQLNEFSHYNSKSIDRRVLMRLRQNIFDLWNVWRRHAIEVFIKHVAGVHNKADILTRICTTQIEEIMELDTIPPYSSEELRTAQQKDQQIQKAKLIKTFYFTDTDGIIRHKNGKVYIADYMAKLLLEQIHKQSGHTRLTDLLYSFQQQCFNPHARKFAKSILRKCGSCELARSDTNGQSSYGPVKRPQYPFEVIGIDLFGPLVRASGTESTKYILTIVDRLTGFTQFIVIPDTKTANICRALSTYMILTGQTTRIIISDNGKQFTDSTEFKDLIREANIKHLLIPIYSPHAGGFYETKHKTAVWVIRTMLQDSPEEDWQYIATVASQQINARQSPDRLASPHELIFGYKHTWPGAAAVRNATTETEAVPAEEALPVQSKRHEQRNKFLQLWADEFELRQQQTEQRFQSKIPRNRHTLQCGDTVMFVNDTIKKKFAAQCAGPFHLIQQVGKHSWKTKEIATGREFILHSRRLRQIDPQNELITKPRSVPVTIHGDEDSETTTPDTTPTTDPIIEASTENNTGSDNNKATRPKTHSYNLRNRALRG